MRANSSSSSTGTATASSSTSRAKCAFVRLANVNQDRRTARQDQVAAAMQPRQQTSFTSLYGIRVAVAVAAVALVSSWVLFNGIANASFYGDESGWISSGMYYSHLLSNRDFTRAKWDCNDCKTWGALNAPLGKLLIGAAYWGCDTPNPCTFNAYYDFFQSFEENQRLGNVPPEYILRRGRYSAATAGVICCLLAFAVGYMPPGRWKAC